MSLHASLPYVAPINIFPSYLLGQLFLTPRMYHKHPNSCDDARNEAGRVAGLPAEDAAPLFERPRRSVCECRTELVC